MAAKAKVSVKSNRKIMLGRILLWVGVYILADLLLGFLFIPKEVKETAAIKNLNPYYNHGFNALATGYNYYGSNRYDVSINSMAMLDAYPRIVKPEDKSKKRILFLGDSFVEGVGFPFNQTFCGYLTGMVDTNKIEILNGGCASFSPKLYYLRLKYLLEQDKLKADEVYCFLDYSDVGDEILYEDFVASTPSVFTAFKITSLLFVRKYSLTAHIYFDISSKAFVSKHLDGPNNEIAEAVYWVKSSNDFLERCNDFLLVRNFWHGILSQQPFHPCVRSGLGSISNHIVLIKELCAKNNINFRVVIYPYPHLLSTADRRYAEETYKSLVTGAGVDYVNLYTTFSPSNQDSIPQIVSKYYIGGDSHWNTTGHELVAKTLLPYVTKD